MVVSDLLKELSYYPVSVTLGEVNFGDGSLSDSELDKLKVRLNDLGFELLDDKKSQLIDKIKTAIIELIHQQESLEKTRLSDYLKRQVNYDYNHISHLFSSIEGVTVEQYFIQQKIEKAKELLVYDELSATEIAFRLGYSSLAHLSGQFKKITGMPPSEFKKLKNPSLRKALDKI